jgi:hypothetical protein
MISMWLSWAMHGYGTTKGPHEVHGSGYIVAPPNLASAVEVIGSNNVDFGNVRCGNWGGWVSATAEGRSPFEILASCIT